MLDVRLCQDQPAWDASVNALGGHPLQLWAWGEVKRRHNWNVERVEVLDAGRVVGVCQILLRKVTGFGEAILYAPRGPVWVEGRGDEVMDALIAYVKRSKRGLVFSVEPETTQLPLRSKFREAADTILMSHTLVVDLTQSDEQILANMAKNHRYYVRRSGKDPELEIRRVTSPADLAAIMTVYHETAERDGFALHPDAYYRDIMEEFGGDSFLFASYHDGKPCAFLWDVVSDRTAFELYGGSDEIGRKRSANYALKWAMIQALKERGVTRYDLNGLLNDAINYFKEGFAKDHPSDDFVGTFDLPLSPLYRVYRDGLPYAKEGMRFAAQVRRDGLGGTYRRLAPIVREGTRKARRIPLGPLGRPDPRIRRDGEDQTGSKSA